MNISKRVFALGEKESDGYSRTELSKHLDILDESGIDIQEYFLSEEHLECFTYHAPDEEKLRAVKHILVTKYGQAVRKEIAIKISERVCESGSNSFILDDVLGEMNKLLDTVCLCLVIDNKYIERHYSGYIDEYVFYEKMLKLFILEYGKSYEDDMQN